MDVPPGTDEYDFEGVLAQVYLVAQGTITALPQARV